jgi:hypothetical protein
MVDCTCEQILCHFPQVSGLRRFPNERPQTFFSLLFVIELSKEILSYRLDINSKVGINLSHYRIEQFNLLLAYSHQLCREMGRQIRRAKRLKRMNNIRTLRITSPIMSRCIGATSTKNGNTSGDTNGKKSRTLRLGEYCLIATFG